jgi:hypothetical protein
LVAEQSAVGKACQQGTHRDGMPAVILIRLFQSINQQP